MSILDANGAMACAECGRQARAVRDRLKAENAKLRELVRDMWSELDASTQYDAGGGRGAVSEFADRARDLGVEVEP